jgi:1-acyl-sn-glycerol-3-phosphate acyltransferase
MPEEGLPDPPTPAPTPAPAYRALRALARAALALYYREVEVHGGASVPERGPLLVLANHHNGLVDPMLLMAACERELRFLAKQPLFAIPLLGWLLRRLRAVPVHRRQDPGYDKEKNAGLYAAVAEALAAGGAVGIFPEGKSHTDPWVAELKHGAARIALEAEAGSGFELGLAVQLVGIQFERTRLFRGRALVVFAPPRAIGEYREHYARDPRAAVEALTASLQAGLSAMILEAEDAEVLELARLVERFGVLPAGEDGLRGRFERRRRLLAAYRELRARRPAELAEVLARLRRYRELLRRIGVRDTHVEEDHLWTRGLAAALSQSLLLLAGAPLSAVGFALNAIPYWAVLHGVVLQSKTSDVQASSGLLVATLVFPLWYLLLGLAGWWLPVAWPVWLPLLAAGPLLGLCTMRWLERRRELLRSSVNLWLGLRLPAVRRRLQELRADVLARIEALAGELGAPGPPAAPRP